MWGGGEEGIRDEALSKRSYSPIITQHRRCWNDSSIQALLLRNAAVLVSHGSQSKTLVSRNHPSDACMRLILGEAQLNSCLVAFHFRFLLLLHDDAGVSHNAKPKGNCSKYAIRLSCPAILSEGRTKIMRIEV